MITRLHLSSTPLSTNNIIADMPSGVDPMCVGTIFSTLASTAKVYILPYREKGSGGWKGLQRAYKALKVT